MNTYDVISFRLGRGLIKLGLSALGCVVALLLAELALRPFWNPHLASWQSNLDLTIPLEPDIITGVAGPARVKTTSTGVRGTEWSKDRSSEYRILAIGGSTTECLVQDQPNTWAALLQALLQEMPDGRTVWVGNAGRGGHHSRHHVLAMRYMLDAYDPDAVIVLQGANDRCLLLLEGPCYDINYIDDDAKIRDRALSFARQPRSLLTGQGRFSLRTTAVWALLRNIRHRLFKATGRGYVHGVSLYRERQKLRRQPWLIVDEMPMDLQPGLAGYRYNLLEMIRIARARGIHLVFMTQPELYKPDMPPEEIDRLWTVVSALASINGYWSPRVMAMVMDEHNQILREVCASEGVVCVDLAALIPSTLEVFWDQHHFTDYGCDLVAEVLAEHFRGQAGEDTGLER